MQSFGEQRVSVDDFSSGTVRVLGIYADSALYPRLALRLGWVLRDVLPTDEGSYQRAGLADYRMVSLAGELRVGEGGMGPIVGQLWPAQRIVDVRSSPGHGEDQMIMACDLDLVRLERIEELRKGQPAEFSINLWPTIIRAGARTRAFIEPLNFRLPRDIWLEFLAAVNYGEYDIVEVRRPIRELDTWAEVLQQMQLARAKITNGEYNAGVAAVRVALEDVIKAFRGDGPPLKEMLAVSTDVKRGAAYASIITDIKDICSRTIHKPDAAINYTRAEALFVVRTAESCIALLAALVPIPSQSPPLST
jgi:hypothetical protein